MRHATEIIKISSNPQLTLEDKAPRVIEELASAIEDFERVLMFLEDVIIEVIEKWV